MFVVSTESVSEVVASIFWILDVPSSLVTIVERAIERESRLFPVESCKRFESERGRKSALIRAKERMKAYLDPSSRKYLLLLLLKR